MLRWQVERCTKQMTRPANTALPLEKNRLFQSGDLDEARAVVARKFCDHRLDRISRSGHFDAVHNRAEGQATSLNYIQYGADVEIEPGELGSFYLVQIPLTGQARIDNSAGDVETGPGLGSVLNPHRHASMRWREGCSQLLLQINAQQLNRVAERLVGRPLSGQVIFQTAVDQRMSEVDKWVQKLRTCFSLAEKEAVYAKGNLHTQALVEEQLIEGFLLCQPSDVSGLLMQENEQAENVHVRRAMQYIHRNLGDVITVGDIAEVLQISPRSLQLGFKAELGVTPKQYLREARLRRAHALLKSGSGDGMIGDICEQVGFGHFGRFSVEYKRRYGESPHETRRRNC
ncbi:AraC family transcriptional regulator [uncultured Mameliella sp.]|uniref:AraC family transcriptional regulator n=1 Tax=uncultured Mameliella sp. TaxID=1447087 RepID=UPI002606C92F|nr:AraC family transcriptional regulator [uncultured Mameliella sp.]